jgi:hypothetical protein
MKRVFTVKIEGSEKELDDITAFEVCEAVRKEVGELSISVSEKKEEE